jgi:flagellar biosynthesis protein FlhA
MSDAPVPIMDQVSGFFQKRGEAILVIGVVLVVGLLVLPLPPFLLDGALALSIALSLLVLLVALNSTRALDFSAFPSVLLLLTLYRLALNVSSTRLILGEGEAGKVIEAFGSFVIGGNYVVGVVIFLILIAINFIVITKGAGRVAEVAARFTLDAMPGRQMSIDGDLSAGFIDDAEAKRRREEISQEADFYGAMDGSAKFVRGDAIAGLLITAINILGGLYVGVVQRSMSVSSALAEYTILTVGDGLVSQIPALILSTAAGIMVTSASGGHKVAGAVMMQLGRKASPLWMASGFLALLAVIPGLPTIPFLALAMASGSAARFVANREIPLLAGLGAGGVGTLNPNEGGKELSKLPVERSPVQELLQVDPLELELGYALIPLVDGSQGGTSWTGSGCSGSRRPPTWASWSPPSASGMTCVCRPRSTRSGSGGPRWPGPSSSPGTCWRWTPAPSWLPWRGSRPGTPASGWPPAGSSPRGGSGPRPRDGWWWTRPRCWPPTCWRR